MTVGQLCMNWSGHYDNYEARCETGHRSVLWAVTQPPTQTVVWQGSVMDHRCSSSGWCKIESLGDCIDSVWCWCIAYILTGILHHWSLVSIESCLESWSMSGCKVDGLIILHARNCRFLVDQITCAGICFVVNFNFYMLQNCPICTLDFLNLFRTIQD